MAHSIITLPIKDAGTASAEQGLVILDGPDGVAVTMTAEAAAGTGRSLIDAAQEALRQRTIDPLR